MQELRAICDVHRSTPARTPLGGHRRGALPELDRRRRAGRMMTALPNLRSVPGRAPAPGRHSDRRHLSDQAAVALTGSSTVLHPFAAVPSRRRRLRFAAGIAAAIALSTRCAKALALSWDPIVTLEESAIRSGALSIPPPDSNRRPLAYYRLQGPEWRDARGHVPHKIAANRQVGNPAARRARTLVVRLMYPFRTFPAPSLTVAFYAWSNGRPGRRPSCPKVASPADEPATPCRLTRSMPQREESGQSATPRNQGSSRGLP